MSKAGEFVTSMRPQQAGRDPMLDRSSLEFGFRSKRFAEVQRLIETIIAERGACRIVDLGGTERYWSIGEDFLDANRGSIEIKLVNLEREPIADGGPFTSIAGDATDPQLLRQEEFDLVHSNSVIEHVGTRSDMRRYASNVRRLAPRYYVQTPNFWFPFEPHFRLLGFQYLPEALRVAIIRNFSVGFFDRVPDYEEALQVIRHHQLVSASEMRAFFPDAAVTFEKVGPFNKSIMAIRG